MSTTMKSNPSSRNSESKDPMRRSFTGNPFVKPSSILANSRGGINNNTPANSPSDFTRRSSFGRENSSSLRDYEDKENNSKGSNLKPGRVQSPASVSKGTKNFMSPTISAVSKFTTSPKRKILVERNEPVRSSLSFPEAKSQLMEDKNVKSEISSTKKKTVSFSDAISMLIEDDLSKPDMGLDEKKIEASHDTTITDMSLNEALTSDLKIDVVSSWENVTDCANVHSTFKSSPRTSCSITNPILSPLDADPSMPPYDPKTNYLSPRPQFLHYKPNPRIELIHCKDRDGKRLEESFISENLPDGETSECLSEDSQKESDDVSSDEMVEREEEESVEEKKELNVSEMSLISNQKPKSRFFTRSMFIALLLALVFACLSISFTDSPLTDLSMLKDVTLSNLYVPPEITKFAKVNFEELARKSRLWAGNYISYVCKLISELRGVHKLGPLQYGNLTSLLEENHLIDGYPKFGHTDTGNEFKYQDYMLAPIRERNVKAEPLEESHPESEANEEDTGEVSEEENGAEFEEQVHQDIDEVVEDHTESVSEEACVIPPADSEAEQTQETTVQFYVDNVKHQSNIDATEQPVELSVVSEVQPQTVDISEAIENQPQVSEAREPQVENGMNSYSEMESSKDEENTQNTELGASVDTPQTAATVDPFSTKHVGWISSLVLLSLLAATAFFIHTKKAKIANPNAATPVVQSAIAKKLDYSPISVTAEHTLQKKLAASVNNWQTEVDNMIESCPSEMSSFKSSSHSKGFKASSETKSQERKHKRSKRRDSLASSDISLSSYSYGSFTTYENIPSNHGHGDDEVVTPVRRSSRIRKQVISP